MVDPHALPGDWKFLNGLIESAVDLVTCDLALGVRRVRNSGGKREEWVEYLDEEGAR